MPDLHPLLVHFPVALLTFGVAADVVGWIRRKEISVTVAWWTQITGTAAILLSVASGLLAKGHVTEAGLLEKLDVHEQLAFVTAAVFVGLTLWRIGARGRIPSRVYLLCLIMGLLLVWGTAWFGGELVYRYGIGVAR